MTPILILAAGASSRMEGADKLLERIDGLPLICRMARAALTVSPDVYVTLPAQPHPRWATLAELKVTKVPVPDAAKGLSASLRAGITALPPAEHVLLLLADMPDIGPAEMRAILAGPGQYPDALIWRGATADDAPGHPVLVARKLWPALTALSGDSGAQAILKQHSQETVLIPLPGNAARTDLDTPQDWAAWRKARA